MLKVSIKYFFIFLFFSIIGVWISNNYGTVDIFWLGYRIHTSVPILLLMMWLVFFLVGKTFAIINWIMHPVNPFSKKNKCVEEKKSDL